MYNISLYPLACKQRWVFNMLITCIPSISSFMCLGSFNFQSIHEGLRVKSIRSLNILYDYQVTKSDEIISLRIDPKLSKILFYKKCLFRTFNNYRKHLNDQYTVILQYLFAISIHTLRHNASRCISAVSPHLQLKLHCALCLSVHCNILPYVTGSW